MTTDHRNDSRAWSLGAATIALLGVPGIAEAAFIPPAGESAYRLLFVTQGTRDATSTNIADYDNFVTTQAALAGDLPSTIWSAVGSVPGLDAATHVDCGVTCNALPIYLVNGTKLADNTAAFFNAASVSLPASPSINQFGTVTDTYVWTGSNNDGGEAVGSALGNSNPIFGVSTANNYDMLIFTTASGAESFSFYAISGAIEVPEPAMGMALLAGGLMVTRVFRRRR